MPKEGIPSLFSLMTALSPEARQKLGEARRARKAEGAEERLVRGEQGMWRLEYWKDGKKSGELPI